MRWPSLLKRKPAPVAKAPAAEDGTPVQQARVHARRRLIGAVVLLGLGVVAFPLVFETQPRPIPVDIPIEIPRRDSTPALTLPAQRSGGPVLPPGAGVEPLPVPAAMAAAPVAVASAAPMARAQVAPVPAPAPAPAPAATPTATPTATQTATPTATPTAAPTPAASAPPPRGRFVLQVGAFTDANLVSEARARIERLGLKTYVQVIDTEAGKRTRVRVGPYETREAAAAAGEKLKAAGLGFNLLTL